MERSIKRVESNELTWPGCNAAEHKCIELQIITGRN